MESLTALNQRLELSEVIYRATQALAGLKKKVSGAIAVSRTDEGWKVILEIVERASVPDTMDLIGVYEVKLDFEGQLVSYERTRIRRRSDLEESVD